MSFFEGVTWYQSLLKIINTGLDNPISSFDRRGIQIIHAMALLGIVAVTLSTFYVLLFADGGFLQVSITVVNLAFFFTLFALSKYGKYKATKYLFISFVNVSLFFNTLVADPKLHVEAVFICIFALYVALFRKYLHILLFSLGTVLLLVLVTYLQTYQNIIPSDSFTQKEALPLKTILLFIAAGIFISITLFFRGGLESKQEELTISNHELKRALTENEEQKQDLEKTLKVNKAITKEVHHRVKNNLQLISSLIEIQHNQLEGDGVNKEMMDIKSRVHSIALIHQKLYQTEEMDVVNMKQYLSDLCQQNIDMMGVRQGVILKQRLMNISLDIDTAVPLGLMVNELITNSLKHAFKDIAEPEICISLESRSKEIQLEVSDNGVGYLPGGKGFGSQLIGLLAKQIKGTVEQEDNKPGLKTIIKFEYHA